MAEKERYHPQTIEPKWQQRWQEDRLYRAEVDWSKPKHYALTMLPYPSGDLHIGHWYAMTPSDTRARYMRMKGFNVLFPMGFDAFGLPAENAAIQRNIHPAKWTFANIERMRGQLRSMGAMFDWEREAVSCDPSYYKWTEWFFKKFFEGNLAYRGDAMVNWSPTMQTVLANEQVIDGKDERTGQPVIQKLMTQWFFRITRYADELLNFDPIDWPEPVRIMQTNWIGRSEGAKVTFRSEQGDSIEIFTTRPDTLWGATFMVLAPEHPLVAKLTTPEQREAVEAYVAQAARETEMERMAEDREKTGVFSGAYAINPVNNERIPIWVADYVLITYGSGAIMAVPAHDQRDYAFAVKYDLPIRTVIQPPENEVEGEAYDGAGVMVNSGRFDGTESNGQKGRRNPAIAAVIDWLAERGIGKESVNYRLRDWLISRQRYWGSPIPMLYKEDGTIEPVPDEQLPVLLPEDVEFMPTGRSPLTYHEGFLHTTAPYGTPARRETDTMDTFMCSSWYQLRYLSPHYDQHPFDPEEAAYWLPVDVYTGGVEHATLHLMYTRFFTKAMRDLGMFDQAAEVMAKHGRDPETLFDEPMLMVRNQGQVLGGEREGDFIRATGRWEGANKLFASTIDVISKEEALAEIDPIALEALTTDATPTAESILDSGTVTGEIVRRTENILQVREANGEVKTVEVVPDATIRIPGIQGDNNVNQLKHHLEVQRMSKSKGNVVNPDELVAAYGADTVRAYLMFAFDWTKGGPWNPQGVQGVVRWLEDIWDVVLAGAPESAGDSDAEREIERRLHETIMRVQEGLEKFSFHTAIAALMELRNDLRQAIREGKLSAEAWRETIRGMLLLMAPFVPHISEELWARLGFPYSIHTQAFPVDDAATAARAMETRVIMKNGKPVDRIEIPADTDEENAKRLALESKGARRILNGDQAKRVIYVAGRQGQEPKVNIVV